MPIYEYKCPKCEVFEVTQRITENALKKCPTCKSKVERMLSRTSFILKGSGWYATDYAKPSADASKADAAKVDSAKSESSTSDSSKSDTSSKSESSSSSNGKSAAPSASAPASSSKSNSDKSTASKPAD